MLHLIAFWLFMPLKKLKQRRQRLAELYRVLAPEGRIVILFARTAPGCGRAPTACHLARAALFAPQLKAGASAMRKIYTDRRRQCALYPAGRVLCAAKPVCAARSGSEKQFGRVFPVLCLWKR